MVADVVDGAFRFCPLPHEVVVFEVDTGCGLAHVGIRHSEEALMVYFAQVYCSDFTRPHGIAHASFSY